MKMKKFISLLLMVGLLMTVFPLAAVASAQEVVSLGANLTQQQKEEILNYFGVDEQDVRVITVTNQEMREYLTGLVPEKQLGTTAYSSAYVTLTSEGSGVRVETDNIAWVTKEMYANVMVTAGIEDADVVITAPFEVSGASALTGITKAFETATGENLDENAKRAANEELVVTTDLAEEVGQDEAADLIQDVKTKVVEEGLKDPQEIKEAVKQIAIEHKIKLTDEQIQQISELMEKISNLDLNVNKIRQQLDNIDLNIDDIKDAVRENQGVLQKIADTINSFFDWVKAIVTEFIG
ncbi:MAG: DUF1002 domain-containing protein [Syntrophaceticus sp.]|nr:DUF1002 domain-containing protein [Syntrophaceticus sp.]